MKQRFDSRPKSLEWLDNVRDWTERICDASLGPAHETIVRDMLPGEWGGQGIMASYLAAAHCILHRWSGDTAHLDHARAYLLLPSNVHTFASGAFHHAVTSVREAGWLSEEDDAAVRASTANAIKEARGRFVGHRGWRRANHPVTAACLYDVYARLWSGVPESEQYMRDAEGIWREWLHFGDNLEDAANYEAFNQCALLKWAIRRGELTGFLAHPGTRAWIERSIDHCMPAGLVPGYGDTCTMELWADWFGLCSIISALDTGDTARRARWNAERMFLWAMERDWIQNLHIINEVPEDPYRARQAWGQIPRAAWYFALGADMLLDAAHVEPLAPDVRPAVTHRWTEVHRLDLGGSWSLQPVQRGPVVSDKAVLRLGSDSDAPSAMIGIAPQLWHDHTDSGAVLHYSHDGVVLLDDSGYMQRYPVFHNLFWAARKDGEFFAYGEGDIAQNRHCAYRVTGLTGGETAQMIVVAGDAHHGLPIRSERRVMLIRSGPMVVQDTIVPWTSGLVGGPLWHAQTVRGSGVAGPVSWAEASVDEFRGMNGPWFKNAEGSVVIANPLGAAPWQVHELSNPDPYASPHYVEPVTRYFTYWKASHVTRQCLHQPRELKSGVPERFVTILVPGSVAPSAEAAVQVLQPPTDDTLVCDVSGSLLVLNAGLNVVSGSWGESDAAALWCENTGVFAHRAKRIGLERVTVQSESQYIDVDLQWTGSKLRGTLSSERETVVHIAVAGGPEYSVVADGITRVGCKA